MINQQEREQRLGRFLRRKHIQQMDRSGELISQNKVAADIGVSPASYSQWVRGTRYPDPDNLFKLLMFFGEELANELIIDPSFYSDAMLRIIVELWPKISEDAQRDILEYVQTAYRPDLLRSSRNEERSTSDEEMLTNRAK